MEDRQDTNVQGQQQQSGNMREERQKRKRTQLPSAEERPEHEVTLTESQKEYYRKRLEPVNAKYDGHGDQNTKDLAIDFTNSILKALGHKTRLAVDSGNLVIKEITFRPSRRERSYPNSTVLTALRARTRSPRRRRVRASREEISANDAENSATARNPTRANETLGGRIIEDFEPTGGTMGPGSSHRQPQVEGFQPTGSSGQGNSGQGGGSQVGSTASESSHRQLQVEGFKPTGGNGQGAGSQGRISGDTTKVKPQVVEPSNEAKAEAEVEGAGTIY